jgi:hypothetical protein
MTDEEVPQRGLTSRDQERLDWWLDAARSADLSPLETEQDTEYPQRRARRIRSLAAAIKTAPEKQVARTSRRFWTFAAAAGIALAASATSLHGWLSSGQLSDAQLSDAQLSNAQKTDEQSDEASVTAVDDSAASLRQIVGKVIVTGVDGSNAVVSENTKVRPGAEISTAGQASVSLDADRARIDLSSATTLRLAQLDPLAQVFDLQVGRVDVSVPKVPGESRLIRVRTSDTVVTVHGTVFSVEVTQVDDKPITSVGVTRGLVSVERHGVSAVLRPGDRWSSLDGLRQNSAPIDGDSANNNGVRPERGETTAKPASPAPRSDRLEPQRGRSLRAKTAEASDLAEQNRLFSQALRSRDVGDDKVAVATLERLLASYPGSPLRSTARSELAAAKKRLTARAD